MSAVKPRFNEKPWHFASHDMWINTKISKVKVKFGVLLLSCMEKKGNITNKRKSLLFVHRRNTASPVRDNDLHVFIHRKHPRGICSRGDDGVYIHTVESFICHK